MITHDDLWQVTKKLDEDYAPYGKLDRETAFHGTWGMDCSSGCRFYAKLAGKLGGDWGVCTNPDSHRAGLLTFEHQGCAKAES